MNILITNSVPSNGGDEALMLATLLGVKSKCPNAKITVLCNDSKNVSKHINYVNIDCDWEYSLNYKKHLIDSIKQKVRGLFVKINFKIPFFLYQLTACDDEKRILNYYKQADYIISSAGGYIHDIYGYSKRMGAYEIAILLRKKIIFLGQSIGPFYKTINHDRILNIFKNSFSIILREQLSKNHLESIGYSGANLLVKTDIAFSLHHHFSSLFIEKKNITKKIVVSFRNWGSLPIEKATIISNGVRIVQYLISKNYEVFFISTCQGLPYYIDDTIIAEEIKKNINRDEQNKFTIDKTRYSIENLIKKYAEFDAYIGMRLHGAILSMLAGTPAFNLGYEAKTKGIYNYCGLDDFQEEYNCEPELLMSKIEHFINVKDKIELKKIIRNASDFSMSCFDFLDADI